MQVQPTPIGPQSRGSRLRRIALIAAVPVMLAAVVASGLAGRSDRQAAPRGETNPGPVASDAPQVARPIASPGTAVDPGPPATGLRAVNEGFAFPTSALGMPVWDVRHAMAAHRQGSANGLVAIKGWLTIGREPVSCLEPPARDLVTAVSHARFFCRRDAVLSGRPGASQPDDALATLAATGLELPQWVLPGTALPMAVDPPFSNDDRRLVPVVVLGRFDDDRVIHCPAGGYGCEEGLVIEQVAWVSGRWQESRTALEPGLEPGQEGLDLFERRALVVAWLPSSGPLLGEALMTPELIPGVEPAAATAAAVADGPVWLLRTVVQSERASFGRDVGWLVLEDATGRVLGSSELAVGAPG